MIQYPLIFKANVKSLSGIQNNWTGNSIDIKDLPMSIPPEFGGPGKGLSPEDLYLLAAINCFTATFKVIAEKSKLSYSEISVEGTLYVDRDEKGFPWMSKIETQVFLKGTQDPERAKALLEKTTKSCLVINSIKTQVVHNFDIN